MKYYVSEKISENISETPEGFLICIGVPIARTGSMDYGPKETPLDAKNGKVVITRDEAEVFRPETIASFEGKPITISHPTESVNPDNWKQLAKGTMQNVRRGKGEYSDSLIADLLVTDATAIALVKNGLREVSCGYDADYAETGDGTGKQMNIIGNHLALVDKGRAGSSYAINDHKGVFTMGVADKIKAIFAKAQDEAMEIAKDAEGGEQSKQDPSSGKPAIAQDAYDDIVSMKKSMDTIMKQMDSMMEGMKKPADEGVKPPASKENAEGGKQANDDENSMESRMASLEAAVKKLLEAKAGDDKMDGDEEQEEVGDKEEESKDDDFEEGSMVGDAAMEDVASRAEILSPGIQLNKTVKADALKKAYATVDGKKVIDSVNGGKEPDYTSKDKVDMLFVAASELMKVKRSGDMAKTKVATRDIHGERVSATYKTPEELNEINAKFYQTQNRH